MLRHQQSRDGFALNHGLFKISQSHLIQRGVAKRMIAQFETGVQPLIEGADSFVHFSPFVVELPFVYESDCGHSFLLKRGQQLRRHLNNGRASHGAGSSCGEIVNGDGNLTIGNGGRRHGNQLERQGQG